MGLKLFVNDEQVWESEGDSTLVTNISGSTRRGEFGRLGVANDIDRVDLFITVRDEVESASDLDLRGDTVARLKDEEFENSVQGRERPRDANLLQNEALEASRTTNEEDNTESADAGSDEAGNTPPPTPPAEDNTTADSSTTTEGSGIRLGG